MDCLIGLILIPEDKEYAKKGMVIAHSLECNISANGKSPKEAAKSLANLLNGHLKGCDDRHINPTIYDEETVEKLMRYCAEKGMPEAVPDVEIGYGLRLRCYNLTK